MKDLKRAYRRYKSQTKLKQRAKDFYNYGWWDSMSWANYWIEVQNGGCKWLRHTGNPCNCYCCTDMFKYKRPSQSEIYNLIHHDKNPYSK